MSKSLKAKTIEAERTQVMPKSLKAKAIEAKRPMRFRPTTGKRRITRVGRKSHQLVPDEVPAVEVRGSRRPDEVPAVMPKSLPTTGVTRPNNVGRTFTLRRKLGHQRRSAAKTGQDWPPPQRSGGTPTFCYEFPLGAATRSRSGSGRGRPSPVRTPQSITAPRRRSFPRATSSSHGSPTMKVFKSFFLHVQSSQESQGQISFLVSLPEIRFQEKGDCYVRVIDPVTLSSSSS